MQSCISKLESWKNRWPSQVGRLTMIKSVLSAIPIYSMSCFKMPTGKKLDNILKKFIWEGAKDNKKNPPHKLGYNVFTENRRWCWS